MKETTLKYHLMLQRGKITFKYRVYIWKFVRKYNVNKHIDTQVTGPMRYPHGEIMFASPSLRTTLNILKVVQSSYVSVAGVLCTTWGKMFTNKAKLNRHMMVHTGKMNPYVCYICSREFHLIGDMENISKSMKN